MKNQGVLWKLWKKIVAGDENNARIWNLFPSNSVQNVNIPKFKEVHPLEERIFCSFLKVNIKCRNHPSIATV